jgi:hypothetical protein
MGDWERDIDGDFRVLGPYYEDPRGKRMTSPELAKMFDSTFDDMVLGEYGGGASRLLADVFDVDTDAYQAVADALEHSVRNGRRLFGIKKVEE